MIDPQVVGAFAWYLHGVAEWLTPRRGGVPFLLVLDDTGAVRQMIAEGSGRDVRMALDALPEETASIHYDPSGAEDLAWVEWHRVAPVALQGLVARGWAARAAGSRPLPDLSGLPASYAGYA